MYKPPFVLSHAMLSKVAGIGEWLGRWKQANPGELVPQLRRGNRIRTIQASLAIEQNTLSLAQMTAVLDGKTVLGSPREIQEIVDFLVLPRQNK
jgi:Fic family protein